jgi:hypothetical protein
LPIAMKKRLTHPPIQFFFKVILVILGLLYLHVNFEIGLSISVRKPVKTLIWICPICGISWRDT